MNLCEWARLEAGRLLAPVGRRWAHSQGVAATASAMATLVPAEDRDVVIAAAWLHDVGYAPCIAGLAFHPLDGARHLRGLGYPRLAALVAYHTGARYEAERRGLGAEMAEFTEECSDVADLVTYADLTTGPSGLSVVPSERLAEAAGRYGPDHVVTQALADARPGLFAVVHRVERRLNDSAAVALRRRLCA